MCLSQPRSLKQQSELAWFLLHRSYEDWHRLSISKAFEYLTQRLSFWHSLVWRFEQRFEKWNYSCWKVLTTPTQACGISNKCCQMDRGVSKVIRSIHIRTICNESILFDRRSCNFNEFSLKTDIICFVCSFRIFFWIIFFLSQFLLI